LKYLLLLVVGVQPSHYVGK